MLPRRSGKQLELMQTLLIALPSFILFGYNQSGVGGLLSIESWVETFPEIDTIHTTGAQKATNSTIQVRIFLAAVFLLGALLRPYFRARSSQHVPSALYLDPSPVLQWVIL